MWRLCKKAGRSRAILVLLGQLCASPAVSQDSSADRPGEAGGAVRPTPGAAGEAPGRVEAPPEYRGAAAPLESIELERISRRAEERFQASQWAQGLSTLDEGLALATRSAGKVRRPPLPQKTPTPAGFGHGPGPLLVRRGVRVPTRGEVPTVEELEPRETFLTKDGILHVPAARALRDRLLALPEEARSSYHRTYEAPAKEALAEAYGLPPGRAAGELLRIAERYPLTLEAADAWRSAAHRLLGAGRPFEAGRALDSRLALGVDSDRDARATLLALAAAAYFEAGAREQAGSRLDEAARTVPDAIVAIRGEATRGRDLGAHPYFKTFLERPETRSKAPLSWPCARGSFDNSGLEHAIDFPDRLGSFARWIRRLSPQKVSLTPRQTTLGSMGRGASLGPLVFFRDEAELVCVNASTGKVRWSARPGDLSKWTAQREKRQDYFGDDGLENASSSVMVYEPADHLERPLVLAISTPLRGSNNLAGKPELEPNLLVAYDARSGKLAWTAGHAKSEWDPLRGVSFAAPPVVSSRLLVLPAVDGSHFFAVALTPEGKTRWVRRLYTYTAGQVSPWGGFRFSGLPFAARDGVAVAAFGHGLLCAFDAASGSPLWASRYRSQIRHQHRFPRARSSAPIISPGRVVVFPPDSDFITTFQIDTGQVAWERQVQDEDSAVLLGADSRNVFVGTQEVVALGLSDGKEAWRSGRLSRASTARAKEMNGALEESQLLDPSHFPPDLQNVGSSIVAGSQVLVATLDGTLSVLDSSSGRALKQVRVLDPRLQRRGPFNLFLAEGELLALSATELFAVESQSLSWKATGADESRHQGERAQLLSSEGRFDEALRALKARRSSLKAPLLIEAVERELVTTARLAAMATGQSDFISNLLEQKPPLVKERSEQLSLRLLEAELLEKRGLLDRASDVYLKLLPSHGVPARSPEGLEVNAGAYASDRLLALGQEGVKIDDARSVEGLRSAGGAETANEEAERRDAVIFLQWPHLAAAREAGRRLFARAETEGDAPRALGVGRMLAEMDPSFAAEPSTRERLEKLKRAQRREPVAVGLDVALRAPGAAGPGKLSQVFWISQEEGFLATSAPESEPLPALVAVCGTKVRIYGPEGTAITERALPGYPDVSEVKLGMESGVEEPALVCARDGMILLSTAGGLYGLSGVMPAQSAALTQPRAVKIAWCQTSPHPLLNLHSKPEWGSFSLPEHVNFFPEINFAGKDALVLLPTGSMYAVNWTTGKRTWHLQIKEGLPGSPPELNGPWIQIRISAPPGFLRMQHNGLPRTTASKYPPTKQFIRDPAAHPGEAALASGGLVALFSGSQGVHAVEVTAGRPLWRTRDASTQVAFVTDTEAWLLESGGKLVARSLRSGRVRVSTQMPRGSVLNEAFSEISPEGEAMGWTLVLGRESPGRRYSYRGGRTQTSLDLLLVKLNPRGETIWEKEVHRGAVTYSGGRFLLSDGSFLLLFSGQVDQDKWSTRAVLVGPCGTLEEILAAEIRGKGTGQALRLQVLGEGLALGNGDGFGWYAARALAPPTQEAATSGQVK